MRTIRSIRLNEQTGIRKVDLGAQAILLHLNFTDGELRLWILDDLEFNPREVDLYLQKEGGKVPLGFTHKGSVVFHRMRHVELGRVALPFRHDLHVFIDSNFLHH